MAKRKRKKVSSESVAGSHSTAVIVVSEEKIRKRLGSDLKRAQTYYKKAQTEWETYQTEMVPRLRDWLKRVEGELPMRIAEVQQNLRVKSEVLRRVEYLVYEYRITYEEAFARVMDEQEHPDKYPSHADFYDDEERAGDNDFSSEDWPEEDYDEEEDSEEREVFYREFLAEGVSTARFAEGLEEMMGIDTSYMDEKRLERLQKEFRADHERMYHDQKAGTSVGDGHQLKRKFREIAKQLHPDLAEGFDEQSQRLWLDVQQAYEHGDEAFLDVVLARLRLSGDTPDRQSCWDLASAVQFYRGSLKSLRKTLTREKKSFAWKFSKLSDVEVSLLARERRSELRENLEEAQWQAKRVDRDYRDLAKHRKKFDPETFRKEEWEALRRKKEQRRRMGEGHGDDAFFSSFFE